MNAKRLHVIKCSILSFFIVSSMGSHVLFAATTSPSDIENTTPPPPHTASNRFGIPNKGLSIISINDLHPDIVDRAKSTLIEYQTKGYYLTKDTEIRRFSLENMRKAFASPYIVNKRLSKAIKNPITTSPFGRMTLEGVIPVSKLGQKTIYGISRIYSMPDKSFLMIKEIDLASGIGIAIPAEAINTEINGFPAILNTMKSKEGNSVTTLTWVTDTSIFTIFKRGNLVGKGQIDRLLMLAGSF